MNYFAMQAIDGAWHTVYERYPDGDRVSVSCGGSEAAHRREAQERQAAFDRQCALARKEAERDHE